MDLTHHLQNQILRQSPHLRPVLDIGPQLNLRIRICHSPGIKHTVGINFAVKMIPIFSKLPVELRGRRQHAPIGGGGGNGTGVHQRHGRNLAVLELASLTVGEIPGGMPDTERIVGRCIPGAEAGAAECRLHNGTGLHNGRRAAISHQFHVHRHGCGIHA